MLTAIRCRYILCTIISVPLHSQYFWRGYWIWIVEYHEGPTLKDVKEVRRGANAIGVNRNLIERVVYLGSSRKKIDAKIINITDHSITEC